MLYNCPNGEKRFTQWIFLHVRHSVDIRKGKKYIYYLPSKCLNYVL